MPSVFGLNKYSPIPARNFMTEKPDNEKPENLAAVSPLVFVLVAISAISIIVALLNSAINTPLVRSSDDAAKQSETAACETRNAFKKTEDCHK